MCPATQHGKTSSAWVTVCSCCGQEMKKKRAALYHRPWVGC